MLLKSHAGTPACVRPAFAPATIFFVILSCFAFSFIDPHKAAPPVTGVTTELRLDEGTGTTAADASGNAHPGTLTGSATWTAGKYGQAVSLNGTTSYINLADHADFTLTPTVSYTWSAWVRNTNFNQWSTVWSQTVNTSNFFYFYAHTSADAEAGPVTNGISVYWYSGTNKLVLHSNNNVLTAGTWSYVTVTYDASQAQASRFTIYVNGADVTNRTDVVSAGTLAAIDPTNIRVGSNQPFGEFLNGAVDEVRYYRRLLTLAEIQTDMNTGAVTDATAPTVSLTDPAAGTVSGTISVSATANDNIGVAGVQFLLDGVALGSEVTTAPYTVSWNTTTATAGAHTLSARARDAAGNTTTSATVAVTVNNADVTPPTVSLTAPAAGTVAGTLTVSATANDNIGVTGVQFLLDGVALGTEDLTSPYSISWNSTTTTDGAHTLSARARDAAGNTTTSATVAVTVSNTDATPPTVSLTAPAAGTVSGTISVSATASDNIGVVGVQFLLDGVALGTEDLTSPYSISWNTTTATAGAHTLSARARDAAGNTTTAATVAVTVDNTDATPPTVSLTAPAAGNVAGTVTVSATATDNIGVAGVQFLLDGVALGTEDQASPYSISWVTTTATNGSHTLSARARDAAGNSTTSATVAVNVNNDLTPPTVSVAGPATTPVTGTITLTATAGDNIGVSGVQFLLDGVALGTEDVTSPYSISWNTATTSNGAHQISARARDAAGNTTTATAVTFTVQNTSLVAAYGFNENTGTTANDNSGNGNTGTLTNGPLWSASGKYGAAIQFDGTNDFVLVNDANSLDLTTGMTLEAWVNPSNVTGYKTAICKENGTTNLAYALSPNNGTNNANNQRPNTRIRIGNSTSTATGTSKLTLNTWVHVASTFDGTTLRLYINGTQVSSTAVSGSITTTTNPLRIGGSTALSQYFAGLIDEVRIYNRALTAAEIQADMNVPIAPDQTAPTVSLTSPAAGNVSGTVSLAATATDNIAVVGVQFLLDGAALGTEDLSSPYSLSWNSTTIANGSHTLSARARDAAGNTATSTAITVNVVNDATPPTVSMTTPAAGTVAGTISVSATASDDLSGVAGVQFLLNGVALGTEVTSSPYTISWNTTTVADGSYTLSARARDASGNTATSAGVLVNVLNHPPDVEVPTIDITSPTGGEVLGTINITVNATDNVGVTRVQYLLNGANLGTAVTTAPFTYSWNTQSVANGQYTLSAKASDAAGNLGTAPDVVVTVNNPPDAQPPTVSITAPAAGNVAGTVSVTATATDNVGVVGVQFMLDGVALGAEVLTTPYTISWNTVGLSNGNHTLTAKARDAIGNEATSAGVVVNVNNDVTPPTVTMTAPAAGNVSGTISVTATATDLVGVVGVQFLLDGVALGTEDLTSPYSISWNTTTIANGSHILSARARDAAGNSATSAGVTVNVNNDLTPPTVSITTTFGGSIVNTVTIDVTAGDDVGVVGVQLLLDGVALGAEDLTAPYSFSWNTTTATNGTHTLTARARDAAGNSTTSAGLVVQVNNTTTNLLTAIHFNEGTGTAAADVSGKAHNGTLTGSATWTAGKFGQATSLNGTTSYVNIADHTDYTLTPTVSYTWSAWVRNNSFATWSPVWSQTASSTSFFYFYAHTTTDAEAGPVTSGVSVYWYSGANKLVVHSTDNVLTTGTWSHIAVTYDASQAQASRFTIYVNGVDVTNRSDVVSAGTLAAIDPTNIRIGSDAPFGEFLNGSIDEVRYYNRLLTASEIQSDMNTSVGVDNVGPTVSVTAPAAGTVSGTVTLTATATDNFGVAGVQFLVDGVAVGSELLSSPYSTSWISSTVANGSHVITARARDAAGNTTTSAGVTVTVSNTPDTQAPTVNLTAPAAGTVTGTISVNATATDNTSVVGVQFLLDGVALGAEDLATPYSVSWNTTTASNGTHQLSARARDLAGNQATSAIVTVTVSNDLLAPTISLTSPTAGTVSGTISLTATAQDDVGVAGVQFLINGSSFGAEVTTAPYTLPWNTTTATNGNYTITARARDAAGNSTTSDPVIVTVSNAPDTELPIVSLTSPAAGTVNGTVTVAATATDNYAVAGVQFLVDGNNLGSEVTTAPYTTTWSTGLFSNGSHTVSARARDYAGNTATASVTVNVLNTTPVISAITVTAITFSSATINWTTSIPATSRVRYGTTTSYGLATLQDPALTTAHSVRVDGLNPATLYHFQIESTSTDGTPGQSTDNSFTSAALAATLGTLNTHTIKAYPTGSIIPWTTNPTLAYDTVMYLAWNYLLNQVPNDPLTGKPAYYSRSYLNPNTQQVVDWDHNPAGLYAMLTESALKYYAYSGNAAVMQLAINVATWHLDHGMTKSTDSWPSVPYSEGPYGTLTYAGANQADGVGNLEPDKIGELGYAWLQLYKYTGNVRFRDAAIQNATVLASKVRTGTISQSPWPFRVSGATGVVAEDYCADVIAPIQLFDALIAMGLGNTTAYQTARTTAWNWMMTYPMQNNKWAQYFEDVSMQAIYDNNLNQYDAGMTARYLMEHPEMDANWQTHVRGIISWIETVFGTTQYGALAISEQTPVFPWLIGSHTSRYASINAMLYEKTGDLTAKEKAYRSFNWASYMARTTGVVIDGLLYGDERNANQWFSDGYGDYIRHFMTGMGAVPEWSPANQTHILRTSSIVTSVTYAASSLSYTTYDGTATDVIHLNFDPVSVTANGVALSKRSDLTQPGWTLDPVNKTIRIYHTGATQIVINGTAAARTVTNNGPSDVVNQSSGSDTTEKKETTAARTIQPQGQQAAEVKTDLKVFPNPAPTDFTARYSTNLGGKVLVRLTDASGRVLVTLSRTVVKGPNDIMIRKNASWAPGIYFITVQQGGVLRREQLILKTAK